jgi:drug/metabolite transporter (DMT)-like permease
MNWFLLAIIGHVSNGLAFVIDKALLNTALKKSATYAAMVGGLSLATIVATPWIKEWPKGNLILIVALFGIVFVLALWAFFEALKRSEATRVVPIVGSLIPILTLIGTTSLFGERLSQKQIIGFACLLIATWILTGGRLYSRMPKGTLSMCIIASFLFASSTLFGKYAFDHGDFVGVFISSRIAAGITGIIIGFLVPGVGKEIARILKPSRDSKKKSTSPFWPVLGQTLGAIGFLFVHLAIKSGSAALVNALQAIQYALLVIAALILKKKAPTLLGENLTRKVLTYKIISLIIAGFGMALVV